MTIEKREAPFKLEMSFGEAMARFARTNPADLPLSRSKQPKPTRKLLVLSWTKTLSVTDAQQPTSGGIVPYLRLVKGSLGTESFQTWFRDTFFDGVGWTPDTFGKEEVETATVPFQVSVGEVALGTQNLTVTHGENRQGNNNTPNTWLHWNAALQNALAAHNYAGQAVRLTRDDNGAFRLEVG